MDPIGALPARHDVLNLSVQELEKLNRLSKH